MLKDIRPPVGKVSRVYQQDYIKSARDRIATARYDVDSAVEILEQVYVVKIDQEIKQFKDISIELLECWDELDVLLNGRDYELYLQD